ncbi:PD-(D/E)XK nuclease-like domain-containing protein [Aquimarina hainanensis]|uniref:PD-(D/E)XK nuclease-like domain-containing protein n=1 Tax=Aquimarina hainanensis TaxID=1578017 RepID=A0ABW5N614_9FLAO
MDWFKIDINDIPDGIYYDMPIAVYHGNSTHFSASSIKEAFKSMAHFNSYLNKPKERRTHLDFGNAFELSLTDEKEFHSKVAIYDEKERPETDKTFRAAKNKEWKEQFYKANEKKLIIPVHGNDSLDVLTILKNSFYQHKTAATLASNCDYQTTVFWTCPDTGLKLKTRPDFWKPSNSQRGDIINDLKTDKNTTRDSHIKSITDHNYPIQAVMQIDGLHNAGLINRENTSYYWIFCSKQTPYNTEVYEFETSDIKLFTDAYKFKLEEIKRAFDKGLFLSYDPENCHGIKTVEFPFYYKKKIGVLNNIDESIY